MAERFPRFVIIPVAAVLLLLIPASCARQQAWLPAPGDIIGQSPQLDCDDASTGGRSTVTITFPDHPELNCRIWCYEDRLGQPTAWRKDGEELIVEHRSEESPDLRVTTTFTPCPDGVSQVVTVEGDTEEATRAINQVNPCFQFTESAAFGEAPGGELDYVDDFVARCFVFTDEGLTMLKDTPRFPCAMEPSGQSGDRFSKRANIGRRMDTSPGNPAIWSGGAGDAWDRRIEQGAWWPPIHLIGHGDRIRSHWHGAVVLLAIGFLPGAERPVGYVGYVPNHVDDQAGTASPRCCWIFTSSPIAGRHTPRWHSIS